MLVKEYKDAIEYLNEYEADLLEREAVSQLVLYNAYRYRALPACDRNIFGVVLDEENKPILHFSNVASYNMAVYAQNLDKELLILAAAKLADYISKSQFILSGINAKYEICLSFINEYKKLVNCSFIERLGMDIMELRELNDVKHVEGSPRLATIDEVKMIADWMVQFLIESRATEINYEDALNKATELAKNSKVYVYENDEHEVVSMAIATRQLRHGVAISYVFTPEEYRGTGYAAANIHFMSKDFLDKGYEFCTMFVDKKNMLTERAYEKVGYHILEDIFEYQLIVE